MSMMQAYRTAPVTLNQHMGEDAYQEPYVVREVALLAFIDWKSRLMTPMDGELVNSNARVDIDLHQIIDSDFDKRDTQTISYRDTITISDVKHKIVSIHEPRDFRARYTQVYIA